MQYNKADCLFICHSLLQDSQPLALSQWQKSSSFGGAVSPNTALDNQENHYSFFSPLILSHFSFCSYPNCNFFRVSSSTKIWSTFRTVQFKFHFSMSTAYHTIFLNYPTMSKKLNSTCCRRSSLHHQIISRVIISDQPIHVWWIVPPCVSNKKTNELWWHIIKCWIDHMKKRGSSASSKIHAIWEISKIQQLRWGSQLIQ